jgi:hypothetical protein
MDIFYKLRDATRLLWVSFFAKTPFVKQVFHCGYRGILHSSIDHRPTINIDQG